jgi:CheY-like chemotaxis protein
LKKILELEKQLNTLGLLEKTREIYLELGEAAALSHVKSSYQLLSKVYHHDKNPQQQLNKIKDLLAEVDEKEFFYLLRKGVKNAEQRRPKILVVEDEFGLQETFRDVFIMEGYEVQVAADGEEGLKMFHSFKPDLVFTDVVMPKLNGLELVNKIRETKKDLKVIYISGFFSIKSLKRDLDIDVLKYGYHCLSKPFKISAMLELVGNYLNSKKEIDLYA